MDAADADRIIPATIQALARAMPFPKIGLNIGPAGPKRYAHANFPGPLSDQVGQQAVNSNRGEKQRYRRKPAQDSPRNAVRPDFVCTGKPASTLCTCRRTWGSSALVVSDVLATIPASRKT